MAHPNPIRRMLDAGLQLSELTQANAERIVKEMVKAGEVRRKDTEKVVREMLDNSREAGEKLRANVRDEVARQFGAMAGRLDQVEALIEQLVTRMTPGAPARSSSPATSAEAEEAGPAKKAASVKKKAAPAKKAAKKKAAVKKKAAPVSSGVAPVTATKRPAGAD